MLFTNKLPVSDLPLYAGLEPLGEASIQTFLSLTFLINQWDFVKNDDYFLGVKCPISIISMIFSCVSLLKGTWGVVNYFKMKVVVNHERMKSLIHCIWNVTIYVIDLIKILSKWISLIFIIITMISDLYWLYSMKLIMYAKII